MPEKQATTNSSETNSRRDNLEEMKAEAQAKAEDASAFVKQKSAETLDVVTQYLEERSVPQIADDVSNMVRQYPLASLAAGIGIGYLIAQGLRK